MLAEAGVPSPPTSAPQATTDLHKRNSTAVPGAKQHDARGERWARQGATKGETYPSISAGVSTELESMCAAMGGVGIGGGSAGGKVRGDGTFVTSEGVLLTLPIGRECIQAASLKRHAVTDSVPLRWQGRMVALSCLRDHGSRGDKSARAAARVTTATRRSRGGGPSKMKDVRGNGGDMASERCNSHSCNTKQRSGQTKSTAEDSNHQAKGGHEERYESESESSHAGLGDGVWSSDIPGDLGGPSTTDAGRHSSGVRPSTAPMHTDGKVVMRRLGSGSHDPPSVVFDPTYSPLKTRRIILDRCSGLPCSLLSTHVDSISRTLGRRAQDDAGIASGARSKACIGPGTLTPGKNSWCATFLALPS